LRSCTDDVSPSDPGRHRELESWLPVPAVAAGLIAVLCRSRQLPPASDQWANSRLLGYDGDSPQDLQDKIDRVRSGPSGHRV